MAVCTAAGIRDYPQIAPGGAGGAIVTWQDGRSGTDYDTYAQKLDADRSVKWIINGEAICTDTMSQIESRITSDGSGGAILTWEDFRSRMDNDIYAQRIIHGGYWALPAPLITMVRDIPQDQGGKIKLKGNGAQSIPSRTPRSYSTTSGDDFRRLRAARASIIL